jgi:hypothetical protein
VQQTALVGSQTLILVLATPSAIQNVQVVLTKLAEAFRDSRCTGRFPQPPTNLPGGDPANFKYAGCYTYVHSFMRATMPSIITMQNSSANCNFTRGTLATVLDRYSDPTVNAGTYTSWCSRYGHDILAATKGEICCMYQLGFISYPDRLTSSQTALGTLWG